MTLCPGCGTGTAVANLNMKCGRSAYFCGFFVSPGRRWLFSQTKQVDVAACHCLCGLWLTLASVRAWTVMGILLYHWQ